MVVERIVGEITLFVELTLGEGVSRVFCLPPAVAGPTVWTKIHTWFYDVSLIASQFVYLGFERLIFSLFICKFPCIAFEFVDH